MKTMIQMIIAMKPTNIIIKKNLNRTRRNFPLIKKLPGAYTKFKAFHLGSISSYWSFTFDFISEVFFHLKNVKIPNILLRIYHSKTFFCMKNAKVCYLSIQFNKYHHNNCYKEHLFCLAIRCVVVQWNICGILLQLQVSMIIFPQQPPPTNYTIII